MSSTAEAVKAAGAVKNRRWINHRIAAHRMAERGQSSGVIADSLRVSVRSVNRYLALPCPEPVPAQEVSLDEFYMQGACGGFPELDWNTRKLTERDECKAVCAYCPVLAKCRTYGVTKGLQDVGVWGGLTREERKREAARRSRVAAGAAGGRSERGVA